MVWVVHLIVGVLDKLPVLSIELAVRVLEDLAVLWGEVLCGVSCAFSRRWRKSRNCGEDIRRISGQTWLLNVVGWLTDC